VFIVAKLSFFNTVYKPWKRWKKREEFFYYERHEIRESFSSTTNPFHIRERNISTTGNTLARHSFNEGGGNHGEENVKRKIMVWKL
jgi:hypothetical protein